MICKDIFIVLMVAGTCYGTLQEKQPSPLSHKSNHRRVREIQSGMPVYPYGQQTPNAPYPCVGTDPYGQQFTNPPPFIQNYPPLPYNNGYNAQMSYGYPTVNPGTQNFYLAGLPNAGNLSPNVIYQVLGTSGQPIIYTPNLQKSGVINVRQGSDEYECSSRPIGGLICRAIKLKMHILDSILSLVSKH